MTTGFHFYSSTGIWLTIGSQASSLRKLSKIKKMELQKQRAHDHLLQPGSQMPSCDSSACFCQTNRVCQAQPPSHPMWWQACSDETRAAGAVRSRRKESQPTAPASRARQRDHKIKKTHRRQRPEPIEFESYHGETPVFHYTNLVTIYNNTHATTGLTMALHHHTTTPRLTNP